MTSTDKMKQESTPRRTVCQEADEIVNGERRPSYDSPAVSFARVAGMWSAYLGVNVTANDVVNMMVLFKVDRLRGGFHRDSAVDVCGYAACAESIDQEAGQ